MAYDGVTESDINSLLEELPREIRKVKASSKPLPLDELFPGDANVKLREALKAKGVGRLANGTEVGAMLNSDGYVVAMAAKVPRTPTTKSFDFVSDIVDFSADTQVREDKIPVLYRIYRQEGIINNAINKTAAFVSAEGNFYVRRARSGNRKVSSVEEELSVLLDYWQRHVNSAGVEGPVTGARGVASIIDQGTRQALIEGSWIAYQHIQSTDVPVLGKSFELPMYLQTLSSRFITIPDDLVGTGLEQFYWEPPNDVVQRLVSTNDKDVKDILQQSFAPDVLQQLKKDGRVKLERDRVVHVKHRGVDTEPFGESFIEPIITDLAYKRSLQSLDFVIIEALINRILIVKVGSDNPDSDYHNIEFAQQRLNLLKTVFDTTDPSMTILWAGPDIDVIDVGVHESLADLDGRYNIAKERMMLSMGVPENLLAGGGNGGQQWAAYEGYRETLRSMQNSFAQSMISIGEKIAELNGYEGVELEYKFARNVLADQKANADLALRTHKQGLSSIRSTIEGLGGDYVSERRNRLLEKGLDPNDDINDEELFTPPYGLLGETRVDEDGNVSDPGGDGGRPNNTQREDLGDERDPEDRGTSV